MHKHGIKSSTQIRSDTTLAQREILAFAFHSDSISARDNPRAGSAGAANSIDLVPVWRMRSSAALLALFP